MARLGVSAHQKARFLIERRAGFAAVELHRGALPANAAQPIRWVDRKLRTV
jgi:hypothetical protein